MNTPLDDASLQQLFLEARTFSYWQDKPVSDALLEQVYMLASQGPTAANSQPARFVFLRTAEAKARLKPHLAPGNVDKTLAAPVTVIVASDQAFYDKLPTLFPHADIRGSYADNPVLAATVALRNSSLQGAYLIMAARALGLDAGPMSGFDGAGVDAEFFSGSSLKSNFLINLGYGERSRLHARLPRLGFAEAAQLL